MDILLVSAPFIGAIAQEVFHWYHLRERLESPKYKRLLRSRVYWVFTAAAVLFGGLGAYIYFGTRLAPGEMLVAGAAFPVLLKKLVAGLTAKEETKLGDEEKKDHPVRDYFSVG